MTDKQAEQKRLCWLGDSLKAVTAFPLTAKASIGHQLFRVQCGADPADWKPMATVGKGVRELRVHVDGEWRVIYLANRDEAVYVLHAFGKKTQRTAQKDLELAKERLKQLEAAHRARK